MRQYTIANMSCRAGKGQCPVGQTCALDGPDKDTCVASAFVNFEPGPDLDSLPPCMRAAVQRSMAGTQTSADDAVMGKLGQPILTGATCGGAPIIPYCQQAAFKSTAYCACQNTSLPNAECVFAPCQGSAAAYKTTGQQLIASDPAKLCPQQNICQNIVSAGGEHNIVQASQSSNCGGTVEQLVSRARAHPIVSILVLILVALLVIVVARPPSKRPQLPTAALGELGDDAGLPPLAMLTN